MNVDVKQLNAAGLQKHLQALSTILAASVSEGAAIGCIAPLSRETAERFWSENILPELELERRVLFGAIRDATLIGTVQLVIAMPENQSHRCEIAKMIVHPTFRRQGIGRILIQKAIDHARSLGKSLVTLDTRSGDVGEPLYASIGFEVAGSIPGYAWDADGKARHATTYMFLKL